MQVQCPSCGAPEEMAGYAAMAVCQYCGAGFYFKDDALLNMGKMAIMTDYPSPLYLHGTGSLRQRRFMVAGRVRYRYHGGFWDEWYLHDTHGGEGFWLAEDEQEYSLEDPLKTNETLPAWKEIEPGAPLTLAGMTLMVDERDIARIEGAEGQLPFLLWQDQEFPYVDASQGEQTITIEYAADGPELYRGLWVDIEEIKMDIPNPDFESTAGWSDA